MGKQATENELSKILIFGGTDYIGKYMVKESVSMGHRTYVYARPITTQSSPAKIGVHKEFQAMGVGLPLSKENWMSRENGISTSSSGCSNLNTSLSSGSRPTQNHRSHKSCWQYKAVINYEEDIAMYTIKVADDPETCNRVVIYRPQKNIISQLELISLWEKKTGKTFNRIHIPEEEIVKLSETLPHPQNIPASILHSVFVKGDLMGYELGEDDLEASRLYPDLEYTTIDQLLDIFLINPPDPAMAAFE